MIVKRYPIGTKVIFTAKPFYCKEAREDSGKIGIIISSNVRAGIFIYDSKRNDMPIVRNISGEDITWRVPWSDIKPLKNYQMLFNFMEQ